MNDPKNSAAARRRGASPAKPRRRLVSLAGKNKRLSPRQGHTRGVSLLRLILPLAAVVLVAIVVVWSQWGDLEEKFKKVGWALIDPQEASTLRMVNPRFAGMRQGTKPYFVTADEALKDTPSADIVHLVNPKGDMTTTSGAWVALMAPKGDYNQPKEILDLDGGVEFFHDRGLHFASKTARIDLKAGTAEGHDPVTGNGPSIDLKGEGFKILEGGKTIIFTGRSRALLYPRDKRTRKSPPKRRNRQ